MDLVAFGPSGPVIEALTGEVKNGQKNGGERFPNCPYSPTRDGGCTVKDSIDTRKAKNRLILVQKRLRGMTQKINTFEEDTKDSVHPTLNSVRALEKYDTEVNRIDSELSALIEENFGKAMRKDQIFKVDVDGTQVEIDYLHIG